MRARSFSSLLPERAKTCALQPSQTTYARPFELRRALARSLSQTGQVHGPSTNAADLLAALQVIRVMAEPLPPMATWPDYKVVWSDGVLQQSADNLGAIFDRMGWTMGGVMEKWGPYIGLAAALGPAGLATYQRVKIHQAEQEAERRRSTPQKAP